MVKDRSQRLASTILSRFDFLQSIKPPAHLSRAAWEPDITISRDPGSGGKIIAKRVASKLKWDFYDKRILKKLSKRMGFSEKIVAKVDEHPRSDITDIFQSWFNPNYISDYKYVQVLKRIILKAGKKGDVVILGRGANHIIPFNKTLHVRITAPLKVRVNNFAKYEKVTKAEALQIIEKITKQRQRFMKQYFDCIADCPDHIDLTLNTTNLSINASADIIIEAYKKKFRKR